MCLPESRNDAKECESTLVGIIHSQKVASLVKLLLTRDIACPMHIGWGEFNTGSVDLMCDVFSSLAVLAVEDETILRESLTPSLSTRVDGARAGEEVFVQGTPFGTMLGAKLSASKAKGILSTVFQRTVEDSKEDVLYLLDVNVVPGMEGGCVCDVRTCSIIGVLLAAPLMAPSVGATFQLALPWSLVMNTSSFFMEKSHQLYRHDVRSLDLMMLPVLDMPEYTTGVVGILDGTGSWASGIVLRSGLIITNAHAVRDRYGAHLKAIQVVLAGATPHISMQACLVHSFGDYIDLAFLKLEPNNQTPTYAALADAMPPAGEDILIAGFPVWKPKEGAPPKFTHGCISKILLDKQGYPAAFTTNAQVIGGASGGPVLSRTSGHVVGIVTSNTKIVHRYHHHSSNTNGRKEGSIFSFLNYCIPINVLLEAVEAVLTHQELQFCTSLQARGVDYIWRSMNKATHRFDNIQHSISKL